MIPKINKDEIQLFIIQPSFKSVTINKKVDGRNIKIKKEKFVKENWLRVWMKQSDIMIRGEFLNSKGTVAKNRCTVFNKSNNGYHTVAHSLEEIDQALKMSDQNTIGFKKNY